ncbi:MAG: hypothetical protein IIC74_06910 [Bacteroidetes bacterium]|nr:hypothetical protein [Bacteroidota bacterium]
MDILIELLVAEKNKITTRLNIIEERLISLGYKSEKNLNQQSHLSETIKPSLKLNGKSIQNQALEVLKDANRFLHKSEIAKILRPFHKDRSDKQLDQRLAVELGKARDKNIILNIKYAKSNQAYVWGSKNWLDESGKIKKEHEFIVKEKPIQEIIEF